MEITFNNLDELRQNHPAWRLLCAHHAPFVITFFHRVFIVPNRRSIAQADLMESLEDELFVMRDRFGHEAYSNTAISYITDWAKPEKGWIRKYYVQGTDEPHYDLSSGAEKAITWVTSLSERKFVGTGSRLMTLMDLLKQMNAGSETNPAERLKELRKKREEIDAQISKVVSGEIEVMDDVALKDRFQQFNQLAKELLSDFREVEDNFRILDRRVREQIAMWSGSKGELISKILGERDSITESDQGRSFQSFWDFLMYSDRQEELSTLLKRILELPPIEEMHPDSRLRRIHHDWLVAGEQTQRTVARLSHQLRRFLDDKVWLENRRIMDILHSIEQKALSARDSPPIDSDFMALDDFRVDIDLPMERPLFIPTTKVVINNAAIAAGEEDFDTSALFNIDEVDPAELAEHIREGLRSASQISLRKLVEQFPVRHGLAEVVTYLHLRGSGFKSAIDENVEDPIVWTSTDADGQTIRRMAHIPRIIFMR